MQHGITSQSHHEAMLDTILCSFNSFRQFIALANATWYDGNAFGRVCVSVCLHALTFESLDLESSFLVCGYIFRIFQSSSYIPRSSGQGQCRRDKKACLRILFCLLIVCLRLKGNLVIFQNTSAMTDLLAVS